VGSEDGRCGIGELPILMSGIVVLACAGRAVNQSAILGPPLGAKIFTLLFFLLTILEA
jgi:hypothetical protein